MRGRAALEAASEARAQGEGHPRGSPSQGHPLNDYVKLLNQMIQLVNDYVTHLNDDVSNLYDYVTDLNDYVTNLNCYVTNRMARLRKVRCRAKRRHNKSF